MKIGDVLSLYTHGYTKEEIATIKTAYESDPTVLEAAKAVNSFNELTELMELANEQKQTPSDETVTDASAESEQGPEQKAEVEALKQANADLEAKLKKIQHENASRDVSGNKEDPEGTVIDIFRNSI